MTGRIGRPTDEAMTERPAECRMQHADDDDDDDDDERSRRWEVP